MRAPEVKWGVNAVKNWSGFNIGIGFTVEDVNDKTAAYLALGIGLYQLYIGRVIK